MQGVQSISMTNIGTTTQTLPASITTTQKTKDEATQSTTTSPATSDLSVRARPPVVLSYLRPPAPLYNSKEQARVPSHPEMMIMPLNLRPQPAESRLPRYGIIFCSEFGLRYLCQGCKPGFPNLEPPSCSITTPPLCRGFNRRETCYNTALAGHASVGVAGGALTATYCALRNSLEITCGLVTGSILAGAFVGLIPAACSLLTCFPATEPDTAEFRRQTMEFGEEREFALREYIDRTRPRVPSAMPPMSTMSRI